MCEVQTQTKREVFGVHDFRGKDEKVRFFHWANWEVLSNLFEFVRHIVGHQLLTPFQQLMITLIAIETGKFSIGH